jgi:putative tryptophan/tyrosine transport system substrate-binding protein
MRDTIKETNTGMVHMRRRDFIALAGGAVTWSRAARAQQPAKVFRIFWVSTESEPDPFLDGFRQGLRERGYEKTSSLSCTTRPAIPLRCGR